MPAAIRRNHLHAQHTDGFPFLPCLHKNRRRPQAHFQLSFYVSIMYTAMNFTYNINRYSLCLSLSLLINGIIVIINYCLNSISIIPASNITLLPADFIFLNVAAVKKNEKKHKKTPKYGELNPGKYQTHFQEVGQNIRFMKSFVKIRLNSSSFSNCQHSSTNSF